MAKKLTREQVGAVVSAFAEQATRKYNGHAFTAGYLMSVVTQLIAELPAEKQLSEIVALQTSSVWKSE